MTSASSALITVAAASLLCGGCLDAEDRSTSWPALHAAIIEPACATSGCHSKMTSQAGVNLATPVDAYTVLTGRICTDQPPAGVAPGNFVFPGDPTRSKLIHLLRGEQVGRMPPDSPLPAVEIELLERWILEGAPCD